MSPTAKEKPSQTVKFVVLSGSAREAETLYLSPQYPPSYDFPWNPDPLVKGNDYKIYDEMVNDDQVKATLALKKNFITNTGWEIQCEDEEIKTWVTDSLNAINRDEPMEPCFDDILDDMLSAYEYGFSLSEPVYALQKDTNRWAYKAVKTRPPHSFRFELEEKGRVIKVIQSTVRGELQFKPDKFLHHVYQQKFGNPYGLSDLSAAHGDWKAKKFIKRFMAIYLERFASPTVVAKYSPQWGTDEINRMQTIIKSIQNNTTIAIPADAEVEFLQNGKDSNDTFLKALAYLNTTIARAILVPDLIGMSGGETSGGSYALGTKQFEVFLGTIKKDRKSLSAKITAKLIQPMVNINFGEDIECKFCFTPFTETNLIEYAKLWLEAVNGKHWIPTDDEVNHLRKMVGFPEGAIERPEPALPPQFPGAGGGRGMDDPETPGKPGNGRGTGPGENGKDTKEPEAEENKIGAPDVYVPVRNKLKTYRALTEGEQKVNFTQIEQELDSDEDKVLRALASAGKDILNDYISQLREKGLLRRFEPEKVNQLQPRFLKPMNAELRGYLEEIFGESYERARGEIVVVGKRKFAGMILPEEYLEVLKAESFKMVGDYTTEITKKAKNLIVDGMKQGIGESAIIGLIREEVRDVSDKWLRATMRTKTTEVFNRARRAYWETDEIAKQIVTAYQYSAILDQRTSEICRKLDQKIFSLGEDVQRITPPLHFNCRSILVPMTKFEDFETQKVPSLEKIQEDGGNLKNFKEGIING